MRSLGKSLADEDIAAIKGAMKAAIEGNFFPDWEFQTLMGVDRDEMKVVYEDWPNVLVDEETFRLSIIGSMNNLLGYPHGLDSELRTYVAGGRNAVRRAMRRFLELEPRRPKK